MKCVLQSKKRSGGTDFNNSNLSPNMRKLSNENIEVFIERNQNPIKRKQIE